MTDNEYMFAAVDKVIEFLFEQGLKYRRSDFTYGKEWRSNINHVGMVGTNPSTGVYIFLYYDFERTGKQLKIVKDNFLNYMNARVKAQGISFVFSSREIDINVLKGNDTSDNDKIENVMSRINKLLALADPTKNPSETEAIAASMKAQELLAKYNLDVEEVTGKKKKEDITQCIVDVDTGKKWKYALSGVIAKSYCCRSYSVGAEKIYFYGYQSDIIIARRVFAYLFDVGNRLGNQYVKTVRENNLSGEATGIYNSFCGGFIIGIGEQLSKHCMALMLVTQEEVIKSFTELSKDWKHGRKAIDIADSDAYDKGMIEGKRAINAQYIAK